MPRTRVAALGAALSLILAACVQTPVSDAGAETTPVAAAPSGSGGAALALINAQRTASGLGAVSYSPQMQAAALAHARYIAQTGNLTHRGAGGSSIKSRIRGSGFCAGLVNENVASGQSSAQSVVTAWMGSAPHRRNILMGRVDHGAVASTRDASGKLWWVMNMGEAC